MPFYKKDNDQLLVAHDTVYGPGYTLLADQHTSHQYPVDGWYWYDTLDNAIATFAAGSATNAVTMRQARLALLSTGKLDLVMSAIESLPSPQKEAAMIEWEYTSKVERNAPLIAMLAPLLGLTEQEIDDLFTLAATL